MLPNLKQILNTRRKLNVRKGVKKTDLETPKVSSHTILLNNSGGFLSALQALLTTKMNAIKGGIL